MDMININVTKEQAIRQIVKSNVINFAQTFSERHISEVGNPNGTINMKIHNVFISALGPEIQYYTSLVRSLDSSLGNMLERMALSIAELKFDVTQNVEGYLYPEQYQIISTLLEGYKNSKNPLKPELAHYDQIDKASAVYRNDASLDVTAFHKTHVSDYCFYDKGTNEYYIIELKIGGDLDNKKARSEKEAIFEQYAILKNILPEDAKITCYFATAYNRFGEGMPWQQGRVRQFFCEDELLIGKDFWDFVCGSEEGYNVVIDEYKKSASFILDALNDIKYTYLGD